MDREYTIHDYKGLKFINTTGKEIITADGKSYPAEEFELSARVVLVHQNEPKDVPPEVIYKVRFSEMVHVPNPQDQQWIDSLEEGVLVISSPRICNTYTYPVCMFKTKADITGVRYSDPEHIIWIDHN